MSAAAVTEAVAALRTAHDQLAALPIDALTAPEVLAALDDLETLSCQLPVQTQRLLARLQADTTPTELGAKNWRTVLCTRWRLSSKEANRRLTDTALLGPRRSLAGQPLDPVLVCTAFAQARGLLTAEHVTVIGKTMDRIPAAVDTLTRAQIEIDLVRIAVGLGPVELEKNATRILFLLDQDGPAPDDTERQRRRAVTMSPQRPDYTRSMTATLTPQAAAIFEALFARLAAPGMANPADDDPCLSGTPSQEHLDRDDRTLAQRQHDALMVIGRSVLESGELGRHHGLPTTVIIRTTLQDLEARAGIGVSGGGTIIPIADVIQMAAKANNYLAVFDKATGEALDLFRARRTATVAQRIMLIARDGGCTKPGCTVPAYGTQVHHAARDWAHDGLTNINDLGLACGPDNRMVGPNGWTTRINEHHDVEWIPPPNLDTGQTRTHDYHRPERLHQPPDNPADTCDDAWEDDLWNPRNHDRKTNPDNDIGPTPDDPHGPEPNAA
jgi:hypothetical protein